MVKYYSRTGGVRISNMPLKVGDVLPLDIVKVETYGDDVMRCELRCRARDGNHAIKILWGCLRSIYKGIVISESPAALFPDFQKGYNYLGVSAYAAMEGLTFHAVCTGSFYYYS